MRFIVAIFFMLLTSYAAADEPDALTRWVQSTYLGCWAKPAVTPTGERYIPAIRISFSPDGSLSEPPQLVNPPSDPAWRPYAESAMRAVLKCNPLHVPGPYVNDFEQWKAKTIYFDPQGVGQTQNTNFTVPIYDVDENCTKATEQLQWPKNSCLVKEQKSYDDLKEIWNNLLPDTKLSCIAIVAGGSGTYPNEGQDAKIFMKYMPYTALNNCTAAKAPDDYAAAANGGKFKP